MAIFFVLTWSGAVSGLDAGGVTDVKVSADAKQVRIGGDGPLGRHAAFVIGAPSRLVVDFENAPLKAAQRRTLVDKGSLKEIRLGHFKDRTRVVLDFGDNPVPNYKINGEANQVIVDLGAPDAAAAPHARKKETAPPLKPKWPDSPAGQKVTGDTPKAKVGDSRPAKQPEPKVQVVRQPSSPSNGGRIALKSAGVTDDLVSIELVDAKEPKLVYRLVLELDTEKVQVRRATLSDHKGNIKTCDFARTCIEGYEPTPLHKITRGPLKEPQADAAKAKTDKSRLKWGKAGSKPPQTDMPDEANPAGDVRVEEFGPDAGAGES